MGVRTVKVMDGIYRLLNSPRLGIIHAFNSTVLLSLGHFLGQVTIQSTKNLPELEIVFFRCITHVVMLVPFLLLFQSRVLFGSDKWLQLLTLSIAGYICYVSLYYILYMIPLSIALSLSATCPFFATVFSFFILKEKCEWVDTLCGIASLLGVLFIARPVVIFGKYGLKEKIFFEDKSQGKYETIYLIGCGVALLFGAARAINLVLARKWAREEEGGKANQVLTVVYPSVFGCLVTPAVMLIKGQKLVLPDHLYGRCSLFSVGILTALGLMSLALSLKTQNATIVGVIRNLDIVWALILQYLFMNLTPSWWSVGGAAVIITATITASFRQKIKDMCSCYQCSEIDKH